MRAIIIFGPTGSFSRRREHIYISIHDLKRQASKCSSISLYARTCTSSPLDAKNSDHHESIRGVLWRLRNGKKRRLPFRRQQHHHHHPCFLVHLVCRGLLSEHDARRASPLNEIIVEKLAQRLDIVKYLYSHGASIDTFDRDGLTPFMYACSSGNYPLVKYLLDEHKAKDEASVARVINERSNTGETCLMYAVESGNLDIVTLLCEHGAKLDDQKSPSYATAAAFYGYHEVLNRLIQLGVDVDEFGTIRSV